MRGTRLNNESESSLEMVKPLRLNHFRKPVRLGFWHNPDTGVLKGKMSSSPYREIFGVHHMKLHVFDDNLLVTGANLSEDYFTDRQDRCMIFMNCQPLADYADDLIQVLTDCSYNVNDSGDLALLPNYPTPYR